jgi:Arc/MetJ-type ribon-helix-helix transcriptional regulator
MHRDQESEPVMLPPELVDCRDTLVGEGTFSSTADAVRHGARLAIRDKHPYRSQKLADNRAKADIVERLERKRN